MSELKNETRHNYSNIYVSLVFLIKFLHLSVSVVGYYFAWFYFRYQSFTEYEPIGFRYNYFVTATFLVLMLYFSRVYSAYDFGFSRIRYIIFGQFLSQSFATILIYAFVTVAWWHFQNPIAFIILLMDLLSIDVIFSLAFSSLIYKLLPRKRTLLIYQNKLAKKRFGSVKGKPIERLFKIDDEIEFDGDFSEIKDKVDEFDAVFIAGVNSDCRNALLKHCKTNRITIYILPHIGDVILREAYHEKSFYSPIFRITRKTVDPLFAFIKRTFDIVSSGLSLILLSPIMLITALAIKLYDKGPAFYKQVRLTKNGREFKIIKFRSMRVDAEKDGVARLSSGDNDDRITPIGRFIRKCRLDELPQLINIFKGDMSVVGPRPERPEIAEQYYETMPEFELRLQVKAGLTGYAQIYGKYNSDPYEKLEFDLLYINQMNLLTDLLLCFATFAILFRAESTEGIEQGQTTAMNVSSKEPDLM